MWLELADTGSGAELKLIYTISFSHGTKVIGKYGGKGIELDVEGLQKAISEGRAPGCQIHSHENILSDIANSRFSEYTKDKLTKFAVSDKELMVEGIIPKAYFRVLQK